MSDATRVLVYVQWDALHEIDRRARAAGMNRSEYMVVMALMPRSTDEVKLASAVTALREGLAQYDAALAGDAK